MNDSTTQGYTAGISVATTSVGDFKISSNGSIYISGSIGIGVPANSIYGIYGASSADKSDKSFRINYRSKDGTDKTETVSAITLENAKSMIKDLDRVNYHIEG